MIDLIIPRIWFVHSSRKLLSNKHCCSFVRSKHFNWKRKHNEEQLVKKQQRTYLILHFLCTCLIIKLHLYHLLLAATAKYKQMYLDYLYWNLCKGLINLNNIVWNYISNIQYIIISSYLTGEWPLATLMTSMTALLVSRVATSPSICDTRVPRVRLWLWTI